MSETLVLLEEACQTKVGDSDLWALAFIAQNDVLVFNVAVHDLFHMNVLYSNRHLHEDLLCLLLR